jgi:glycine betaine/proline transport system permease protein
MFDPDNLYVLPVDKWIQAWVEWLAMYCRPFFMAIKWPIESFLNFNQHVLQAIPLPIFVVLAFVLAWAIASRGVAIFSALALIFIAFTGVWAEAVTTLAQITTAIVLCIIISVPLGVVCARRDTVWKLVRPCLDVMQTTPTFVYLVPVVMLFGVGTVPGEVAVITAAAPPLIRFTNLGIRMVDKEMVEAGMAFGATRSQLLWEIQLPMAMPTILGGLNQTVLTAMVMSVVVAMIGADGLGLVVLQGLGRLDVGRAAVGGIAIVLLAMILDRITQSLSKDGAPRDNALRQAIRRLLRGHARTADTIPGAVISTEK